MVERMIYTYTYEDTEYLYIYLYNAKNYLTYI
jgi:hypothetical protein